MRVYATTQKAVQLSFDLTAQEARTLMGMMQNYMPGDDAVAIKIREQIFKVIKQALET